MIRSQREKLQYILIGVWLLFTLSLAGWWYIFSTYYIGKALECEFGPTPDLHRYLVMLTWEGGTLLLSIMLGGAALTYYMLRERRQRKKVEQFFATFTHELKTPISSLRLQVESLQEDLQGSVHSPLLDRLVADSARLNFQLENSLLLANAESYQLVIDELSLKSIVNSLELQWPGLRFKAPIDVSIQADAHALECVIRNLVHNAVVHGRASQIDLSISSSTPGLVQVLFVDNGTGFTGNRAKLGNLFERVQSSSGNGIGLHLSRCLVRRMGGQMEFPESTSGFVVALTLRGSLI